MKTVKISELKANLSANLRLVSSGEEVLVYDRNRPIARIVPLQVDASLSREDRLIQQGVLSAPTKPDDEAPFVPNPVIPSRPISQAFMDAFWEDERADRA